MKWSRLGESKGNGGMGYRDFRSFNIALLAKQAWRLWKMPQSLVGQIMEAKYYKGRNFLESQLGNRPSFAWRSIHSSQKLLLEGLVWRIGNGLQVRIWKDRWIPRSSTFMIPISLNLVDPEAKVSELIDPNTHWWNPQLLENYFSREEAQTILSIPVSVTNQADVCIWHGGVLRTACLLLGVPTTSIWRWKKEN
jgi:hypothetical protein